MDNRREALARRRLAEAIHGAPQMMSQRRRVHRLSGATAQAEGPGGDVLPGTSVPIQRKSGWESNEKDKFHRVANKDNVKAVPTAELELPAKSVPVDGKPESKGRCWYPTIPESTKDTEQVRIVIEHDSDPGGKITPYSESTYSTRPAKGAFLLEPHFHNGTLPAARIRKLDQAGKDDFTDKPVTYTDTMHLYEDAHGPATFKKGL